MTKETKKRIIWIVVIIILSNTYPLRMFIRMGERDAHMYSYSTIDDPKTTILEYGMGPADFWYFQVIKDSNYLKENPSFSKYYKKLYRNFRINPLFFWHWWDYFFDERYTLPYVSRKEVIRNWEREMGMKYEE